MINQSKVPIYGSLIKLVNHCDYPLIDKQGINKVAKASFVEKLEKYYNDKRSIISWGIMHIKFFVQKFYYTIN